MKNAGKASAANVPSATQIANAPEASAAAAGNAANAAAAANGHADHKPAAIALTGDRMLHVVDPGTATVEKSMEVQGVDRLLGIDLRPATGQLIGVSATFDIVEIDPETGMATKISTMDKELPVADGAPVIVDFNPKANKLRFMSGTTNHRVDIESGKVTVDGSLAFESKDMHAGEAPAIVAAAYTNSHGKPETTAMYDIDSSGEIDRQEFIAMMKNGLLLGVDEPPSRDELRDAFRQVDVDRSGAVSFPEFYAWFNHTRNVNATGVPGLDKIVPVRDRALRDMLAAYRRGELELDAEDLKPPKPKGAPRRKRVKDAPVVVQKESLASRLAAKSRTMDTNDSVIKRRLKAKRERDAQEQADLLAKDFRANCAKIFDLIDEDGSGTLSLPEIMLALKGKPDVLRFIKTCRNPVLSEFLVPPRVQAAMKECDTNDDGELDRDEWKALSDRSLEAILERHALARGTDDEFIDEFLDMAVIVYDLIDEDMNGTLSKEELVKACGEVSGGVFLRCLQISRESTPVDANSPRRTRTSSNSCATTCALKRSRSRCPCHSWSVLVSVSRCSAASLNTKRTCGRWPMHSNLVCVPLVLTWG